METFKTVVIMVLISSLISLYREMNKQSKTIDHLRRIIENLTKRT